MTASAAKFDYDWRAAADWLVDQQLPDGGFPGPSGDSDPEATIDAVTAAYSIGFAIPTSQVLARARDFLLAHGPEYAATGPGQAARLVLASILLEEDPGAFGLQDPDFCDNPSGVGGVNLFALMTAPIATPVASAIPGIYGDDLRDHAYVLIAFKGVLAEVDESALEPLRVAQTANGGWARDGSTDPGAADTQTTALILQALSVTDLWDYPIVPEIYDRGLKYLQSVRAPEGGFAFRQSEPPTADASSTALVVQALIAGGEDLTSPEWGNPLPALAQFQAASGGFRHSISDEEPNLSATSQAILAMEEMSLPLAYHCF